MPSPSVAGDHLRFESPDSTRLFKSDAAHPSFRNLGRMIHTESKAAMTGCSMSKNISSDLLTNLLLMGKHLPTRHLLSYLPPEDRLHVDDAGNVWVTVDPLLVILKGHLIIEKALTDICARLLKNPSALERENVRFSTRLDLVCALLDPALPEGVVHAMRDLNRLRNALAHNLEPDKLDRSLEKFFRRFDELEDLSTLHRKDRDVSDRIAGCIAFLIGILSNAGMADETVRSTE